MSKIQSMLFNKKYYNQKEAKQWLKDNNLKPIKRVDITKNFYRYRIRQPTDAYYYRIKKFKKGIEAVIMFKKKGVSLQKRFQIIKVRRQR